MLWLLLGFIALFVFSVEKQYVLLYTLKQGLINKGVVIIMMESKKMVSNEDIMKLLDTCYEKSLNGIPMLSQPIEEMVDNYLGKHSDKKQAAKALVKNQILKCTTSGFLTGFGGLITLPVTIPANVGSVLYVQMRMIAAVAYLAGFELNSDQTQSFVYACLAGVSLNEIFKQAGIKFGTKFSTSLIKKIPGTVMVKINQKVGFRFITKFGEKGIINLGKMIPAVGAVIGGGIDFAETKAIGNRAIKWFFTHDFYADENDDQIIDYSDIEITESEDCFAANLEKAKNNAITGAKKIGAGITTTIDKFKDSVKSAYKDLKKDELDKALEQIEKLASLKNDGIITQEEFEKKKCQLLNIEEKTK